MKENFKNLIKYWLALQKTPINNTLTLDSLDSKVQIELSQLLKPHLSSLKGTTATYNFMGNKIVITYDAILIDDLNDQ